MVTGYTSPITSEEGISFKDFVLHCAKAFLIGMKDRGGNIPEKFEYNNYHLIQKKNAIKKYEEFTQKTEEEKRKQWYEDSQKEIEAYRNINQTNMEEKQKYEDMLLKVLRWKPPTQDHQGLKVFMIEQIEGSIKFDIHFHNETHIRNYDVWVKDKNKSLEDDIKYHSEYYENEVKGIDYNNEWIKELREVLK